MRHVLPVWVFLDAVIKRRCSRGEFPNHILGDASAAFGIGVSVGDAFLNPLLEPIPLLFGRFGFHLPEHPTPSATAVPALASSAKLPRDYGPSVMHTGST